MEKPVIILGGGYLGTFLALRLKETRPHIPFILYEESTLLGSARSETFFDNGPSSWLVPFISKSWSAWRFGAPDGRTIHEKNHFIDGQYFHQYAKSVLGHRLELNKMPTPEISLREGAFVIDARNNCHFQKTAFRLEFSIEVVLENEHHLETPLIFQTVDNSMDEERLVSFYPLGPRRLYIKESWLSLVPEAHFDELKAKLVSHIYERGWRILRILKEEQQISELPFSGPVVRTDGKVISLAGFINGPEGSSIPLMAKLVDKMLEESFRFGEVQRVVKEFRIHLEARKVTYYQINNLVRDRKLSHFYHWLNRQEEDLIVRYYSMKLTLLDRILIKVQAMIWRGKSHSKVKEEVERHLRIRELR